MRKKLKQSAEWEHGEVIKSLSLAGYKFTKTSYKPEFKLSAHFHKFAYFCFVLRGNFIEIYDKKETLYNPATFIVHPSNETHSNHFYTKSRCFNIQISSNKFQQFSESKMLLETTKAFENGTIIYLLSRLYKELLQLDEFSSLTVEGLMLEILAETFRQNINKSQKFPPRWLLHIKDFIEEKFAKNLTIDLLANTENVHPTHLAREYKRYFKTTIGDHIKKKRIELTCIELTNSKTPIKEIALETGFFDQSHFTRVFKKATNTTPSVYRKTFQSAKIMLNR